MQATLLPDERLTTGHLKTQPRRHTAVPKAAEVLQASIQALYPSSYHFQDGITLGHDLPSKELSAFEGLLRFSCRSNQARTPLGKDNRSHLLGPHPFRSDPWSAQARQ